MEIINTFVIPYLNNKDGIKRCLETLYKYTPHNFRVILVDQSEEGLPQEIIDKTHLYIRSYRKLGFAKATNTGIRLADTKYVTALNDDVEFINIKWWDGIEKTFAKYDKALGVNPTSPRNLDAGGTPVSEWEYKKEYTDEEYNQLIERFGKIQRDGKALDQYCFIDGICTWCTVYRKDLLDKVGLYDETFPAGGGEDYDLDRVAYLSGYRMIGTGMSIVWHWWCTTKNKVGAYNLVTEGYNKFKSKWGSLKDVDEKGKMLQPDIYGKIGKTEIPKTGKTPL